MLLPFPKPVPWSSPCKQACTIGITDVFSVPRDFNLALLDHLVAEPGLTNISCCNELNAGYAADGHGRSRRVCACVVARSCM